MSLEWSLDVFGLAHRLGVYTTCVTNGYLAPEATLRCAAERMNGRVGSDVPWHVSGYQPVYRFTWPPTPVDKLDRTWHIGKQAGLNHVYLGNVPGHSRDNTYCPARGALLMKRLGFDVQLNVIQDGLCPAHLSQVAR